MLIQFHRHICDRGWHFSCGTKDDKVLMDQFHHVSAASIFMFGQFTYQEAIEDTTLRMGAGMAKFLCNEVRDYLEDINEIPKPRMFWPRRIWGKYIDRPEMAIVSAYPKANRQTVQPM
ncbi:PREDICTED: squalene synthase-like [Tarenaya hassleriana]|uniref:squalene synthase-like n=1 Tax=Tarenaya hassleriana TaxID=28532 RepID=UPI00053CA4DF|nr:PREDICTED: squalene synthase-like [Tarenaya hassleriana]